MANPVDVDCPVGVWTPVAVNVITGMLYRKEIGAIYLYTYRLTGQAAPSDEVGTAQIFIDEESSQEVIAASAGIDVYIKCKNKSGAVMVAV